MKQITLFMLCFASIAGYSQSKADTIAIKETALNYVEGYYNADWQRVTKALHPELVKRVIIKDSAGNAMLQNMGASSLIFLARRNKNPNVMNPDKPFAADVIIYDIYNNVATLKVVTNKFHFIDYIHMGKFANEWKIVNVLWEISPK